MNNGAAGPNEARLAALQELLKQVEPALTEEQRDARLQEMASAAGKASGASRRGEEANRGADSTKVRKTRGSTQASTILARLKRDAADPACPHRARAGKCGHAARATLYQTES
jgi:hypothetical protein